MSQTPMTTSPPWWRWLVLLTAAAGLLVVAWVCLTEWGGVVHGHPAYPVLLVLTVIGSVVVAWRARRSLPRHSGWRRTLGPLFLVLGLGWLAGIAWLRPMSAVEPALGAVHSDSRVSVTESPTRIVMTPTGSGDGTAVFFQPGALGTAPAAGLFLYASYPAGDVSGSLTAAVLSVSGSRDGLSTPEKVDASRADLPADAEFTVIDGAVHSSFGDYGPQPGDGTPTISQDDAREQISRATVDFVNSLDR